MHKALFGALLALSAGCYFGGKSSSSSSSGGASSSSSSGGSSSSSGSLQNAVTLTASLVTPGTPATALGGYALECSSMSVPPATGRGVADGSGAVSVSLPARGLPIVCMVQDAAGTIVAAVNFTGASGQALGATFGSDTSLGTLRVDTTTHLATAALGDRGAIGLLQTTPAGLPCGIGVWFTPVGPPRGTCADGGTTSWIVPLPDGGAITNVLQGPIDDGTGACPFLGYAGVVEQPMPDGGYFSTASYLDNGCTKSTTSYNGMSADCRSSALVLESSGCQDCTGQGGSCLGCGSATCPGGSYTAIKL